MVKKVEKTQTESLKSEQSHDNESLESLGRYEDLEVKGCRATGNKSKKHKQLHSEAKDPEVLYIPTQPDVTPKIDTKIIRSHKKFNKGQP